MRHLILLLVLLLSACSLPPADADRVAQAEQALHAVETGDKAALDAMITDRIRPDLTDEMLAALTSYVPAGAPGAAKTVSWQSGMTNGQGVYRVVREYPYPDAVMTVDTVMVRDGKEWKVDGIHVNSVSATEAALGEFTLSNKSPLHYGVLLLTLLAPIVCLGTAVVAGLRRRWSWMIFSLFGIGQFAFNWGTGASQVQVVYFSFLSAGFLKGPLVTDPWMFSFGLPIPALLFWALRKWKPKVAKKPKAPAASSGPS